MSREKKWTPGPWEAEFPENSNGFWYVNGNGPFTGGGGDVATCYLDNTEANAHLIASAPELLEALEAAVECGLVPQSSVRDGGAARHIRQVQVADQVRAAIAKAYGETE